MATQRQDLPFAPADGPKAKAPAPRLSYQTDLLQPLATLTWQHCISSVWNRRLLAHCAALHDKVAVLTTSHGGLGRDVVHISTNLHTWTSIELAYRTMSLAVYQSKFVLVGGRHPSTDKPTNVLLTSTTGHQWEPSLPPMPTSRYHSSSVSTRSPEGLVVVGGTGSDGEKLGVVEILLGDKWITVDTLPVPAWAMSSTLHEGNLYFMTRGRNPNIVMTCSTTELISLCRDSRRNASTDTQLWRQFQAPGGHKCIVSFSSRLVIMDGWGIARGYSTTTQSWVEASIAGDRPDNKAAFTTATVLPTGDIIYCHDDSGIYTGTISMSTYSPDIKFQSNVLTRLEAVMGIEIEFPRNVSIRLEKMWAIEVEFPRRIFPRRKAIMDIEKVSSSVTELQPSSISNAHLKELIFPTLLGFIIHYTTWRELLIFLKDMDLVQLSEQIEEYMKGEFKFTSAYHHFVSTKDVLEMRFLKFFFSGPPFVGKTTALRRLIGEIIDLLSAGEVDHSHSSTGTVESKLGMVVKKLSSSTAVVADTEWCSVESHTDEVHMLLNMLLQSMEVQHAPSTSAPATDKLDTGSIEETPATTFDAIQQRHSKGESEVSSSLPKLNLAAPPDDIPMVVDLFKKALAVQPKFLEDVQHLFRAYLRIEDTGGQPELMDMLPALTIGPGLYLLFFNLQWNLKEKFKVFYRHLKGKTTTPEESMTTLEEILLSTLSSISCSSASADSFTGEEMNSSDMRDILKSSKSVAYFVGTHKDKVSEKQIKLFDKDLQCVIRGTDFFEKGLVKFCSEDNLIVTLNNLDGGVEEVNTIRSILNTAMEKHFKPLRIPAVWLLLNLCLHRNEDRTASIGSVLKLSSQLNMSVYETKTALWFLHHHAGVMMYFPNIPFLEDLVILDSQIVYDSVTSLIIRAKSFDSVGQARAEKFRETGQFVLKDIIDATGHVSRDIIPPQKLIALLEFLHIIAPIPGVLSSQSAEDREVVYLMPCVLRTASREELDMTCNDQSRPNQVAPLMIRYKCGFVPLGIFPAFIASLIANKSFKLVGKAMMKNKVQFRFDRLRTLVSFLCYPKFYAIIITKLPVVQHDLHEVCTALKGAVSNCLERVNSRMNYGYFLDYQFAFDCPSHPGNDHLCVVEEEEETPEVMDCLKDIQDQEPVPMQAIHKVWFYKVQSSNDVGSLPASSVTSDLSLKNIMKLFHGKFSYGNADMLGVYLDIPTPILDGFRHDNRGNASGMMVQVIGYWLDADKEKSWNKLAGAMEMCSQVGLADEIRSRIKEC